MHSVTSFYSGICRVCGLGIGRKLKLQGRVKRKKSAVCRLGTWSHPPLNLNKLPALYSKLKMP